MLLFSSFSFKKPVASPESTVVGYYMQNEPIPYRITLPGKDITLGQLKIAISKKDNYRLVMMCIYIS